MKQDSMKNYKDRVFPQIRIMGEEFELLVINSDSFSGEFQKAFGTGYKNKLKVHLSNLNFLEKRIFKLENDFSSIVYSSYEVDKKLLESILLDLKIFSRQTKEKVQEIKGVFETEENIGKFDELIDKKIVDINRRVKKLENEKINTEKQFARIFRLFGINFFTLLVVFIIVIFLLYRILI